MGPHQKTILTIVGAVGTLAALIAFPTLAKWTWVAMWVVVGCGVCACVYGAIYSAYNGDFSYQPTVRVDETDEDKAAAFDPVI